MTPERARILLHAYLDGELDAASTIELETEIDRTSALRQELVRLTALQTKVREAGYFDAPPGLKERVFASLPSAGADNPKTISSWWHPWAIASSAMAAVLLAWIGGTLFYGHDNARPTTEVVTAHIRSLMADHLTDLASAERHTIKPWLSNRLDFAPPVPDLSDDGFPLLGGRLDYLQGKAVAALVFQHRRHVINVFIWPTQRGRVSSEIDEETYRGYNTVQFASRGMTYWIVSDVNMQDLRKLAGLLSREN